MRNALLAALLAATTSSIPQADVVVTGRVTNATTGAAIVGAQVSVVATRAGALTAADGRYRITVPASVGGSELRLRVQSIGYATLERVVRLQADSLTVDFALAPAAVPLSELVVAGAKSQGQVQGYAGGRGGLAYDQSRAASAQGERFNTESYDLIEENPFLAVSARPLSTFSIDVDRASYSNIRRFIREGKLPPKDAVRVEEMVNYFPYAYSPPVQAQPFSVTTELASAPWQSQHRLVRVGLQARRVELAQLPPNNLVFLIDVSGSMMPQNKLPLIKQALRMLVGELRPVDRVAMVVYAGRAGLVLPSTSGENKERILEALDALEAGGSTAGGAGLRLAYDIARENHLDNGNNRVILATDGDFNVGVSSDAEMVRLIEDRRGQGTFLTVLGFGMGNLKDSKLEKLADHGNGNYAYIDDLLEARKVLVTELGGTLLTVAKDVKLQVEFNPKKVRAYRLIGYENRLLRDEDFADDRKDAGEIGAGHSVTALYEVIPAGVQGTVDVREPPPLRYQQAGEQSTAAQSDELMLVRVRYKEPTGETSRLIERAVRDRPGAPATDLQFSAAVAAFGMLLRDSKYSGQANVGLVLELARASLGQDPGGHRAAFITLVEAARGLGLESRKTATPGK